MKHFCFLLLVVILIACNTPKPAAPPNTLAVSPSPVATVSPVNKPAPIPSTNAPTRAPVQPTAEVLLPALERTIDLGPADFENFSSSRLMALDDQADRLYVSLSPSRTVVLDANSFTSIGEIPFGGALSVNPAAHRLYVGVPGSYLYSANGTSVITPAELKLFNTSNLTLLRTLILSETSTVPLAAVDPVNNIVYLTQNGITLADATTLDVQGMLSGTFSVPDAPVPNYTAVDAAVLPQHQRLFVSLNNGIPGSNNGNVLAVYDLVTQQVIAQDLERSVSGFAVDDTAGEVVSPRSHIDTYATVKYDAQGNVLKRLEGASGLALLDARHDRVYLVQWDDRHYLTVLDRDLNFLGTVGFSQLFVPQAALIDPERDRVLALLRDGQLFVLAEQAEPAGSAVDTLIPDRKAVLAIRPSPVTGRLFAIFAPDEYTGAYGVVFRSDDTGATWEFAAGLPHSITDLKFADQTIFAAAGGNGVTQGYGIWRSDDGGQRWLPSSRGLTDLSVTRLAVSPDFARDGTLFALGRRGVFRTSDRGATWVPLADRYAPLLKDLTVAFNAIALSSNFAQDNTLLIGHTSGLWRSTDRGETWTAIDGTPPVNRLAYAPNGSTVIAIDYDGVHHSTDGGLTWQLFNVGLDLNNGTISEVQFNDREAVVLVTSFDRPGAVYRLPLNGTTWQRVPIEADVSAVALTSDDRLFVGTKTGAVQYVK